MFAIVYQDASGLSSTRALILRTKKECFDSPDPPHMAQTPRHGAAIPPTTKRVRPTR